MSFVNKMGKDRKNGVDPAFQQAQRFYATNMQTTKADEKQERLLEENRALIEKDYAALAVLYNNQPQKTEPEESDIPSSREVRDYLNSVRGKKG